MPRLLFLITDLDLGGTPTVVRELATRLRGPGVHIEVACLKPAGPVGDQLRAAGIDVTAYDARHPRDLRRVTRTFVEHVRTRQIDTVFSFLIHANFVAWLAARKLRDVRFLQSIQTTQPRPRWHWWLQRRVQRAAARIIVPSESAALRAIEWSGVPRAKLVVIPNAVDVEAFTPVERGPADAQDFRVGFVGRLDPVKRVPDLVEAMKMLPDGFSLDVYGEGVDRDRIARAVDHVEHGRRHVTLHGAIADTRQAYGRIDALVLPSEAEGFGLVLIEAMAAGVPVIGTDVDGIHDVVHHEETGLLVPPGDPPALAAAIRRLSADPALRGRLVNNARAEVTRRFAWPAVLAAYRDVLQLR